MKYLDDIRLALTEPNSVTFDGSDKKYYVTYKGEVIIFEDSFFDELIQFHNIYPTDIINDCKKLIDDNVKSGEIKNG